MAVFNAIDHQVRDQTSPETQEETRTSEADHTSVQSSQDKTSDNTGYDSDYASGFDSDDNFVFADNPEEDASEGRYQDSTLTFSEEELSDSFLTLNQGSRESGFREDDDAVPAENIDESWAEAILEEESDEATGKKQEMPENEPREASTPETPDSSTSPEPRQHAPDASGPPAQESATSPTSDSHTPESAQPEPAKPETTHSPWAGLQRDPVPAFRRHHNRGRFRAVLWTVVVLALAAGLIAQVTWFQFDRLSTIPELRPFYEKGCELAGCELKPLVQLNKIQSRKLVVRTDPDDRNQLLVDAEIVNEADFEQPFPAIALTFSNLNGNVVAQSIFSPDEYLAGEGKELSAMPPGTRVRIAIGIRDPGRDAVNYNMAFRPNPELR